MTKDEAITHFWEFLFETGAACEYVKAFEEFREGASQIEPFLNTRSAEMYLYSAFPFGASIVARLYWRGLSRRWMQRLSALNNCK